MFELLAQILFVFSDANPAMRSVRQATRSLFNMHSNSPINSNFTHAQWNSLFSGTTIP